MLFCKYLQKDRNDKLGSKIAATPEISSVRGKVSKKENMMTVDAMMKQRT